jgi:hypothetical protein
MNSYEISDLSDELKAIVSFMTEFAAREVEFSIFGARRVASWDSYRNVASTMHDIDNRVADVLEFARATDRATWNALNGILGSGQLGSMIGRIQIWIQIESNRRHMDVVARMLRFVVTQFGIRRQENVFARNELPVQQVLTVLHRTIPLLKRLENEYWRQKASDDKLYIPSNLDQTVVIEFIEAAILDVRGARLNSEDRKIFLAHLESVKAELISKNASWRNVVGALVIISTLLSGLSDSPKALENVSNAIQYILGTSVRKSEPPAQIAPDVAPSLPSPIST